MTEQRSMQEIVFTITAHIIERDEQEHGRLIESVAQRVEGGEDVSVDEAGFSWKRFAIRFFQQHPGLTAFAPVAAGMWIFLIYQFFAGWG